MRLLSSTLQCAARGDGEDRVRVVTSEERLIVVVADGAGGMGGGAAAAECVVSEVMAALPTHDDSARWTTLLMEIDATLSAKGDGQAAAVIASVHGGEIVGAAVGDTVAWLVSHSAITDLTVGTPRKPLLGDGAAFPRSFGPVPLEAATLLLATDGLWKYATRPAIAASVRDCSLPGPCDRLVDLVRLRSGALQDDVAAAIVRAGE